jgi:hypothetical protein
LVPVAAKKKTVGKWVAQRQFGGVNNAICCISGHPKWELVPLGRGH